MGGVRGGGRDTKPYEAISLMQEVVASADPIPVSTAIISLIQKLMLAFFSSFIISFTIYGFTIYYLFISFRMDSPTWKGEYPQGEGVFSPDGISPPWEGLGEVFLGRG